MPTVRANCASCGDVEFSTRQVRVLLCRTTGHATYAFQCPVCHLMVSKPAEPPVVDLLASAGVRVIKWDLPPELQETKSGPPITHDDLLAFHEDVQCADWLDQLISHATGD
jgi:hypothetical protein